MPTTFEIFPAIGIARVGTSDEFFIGPEPDVPLDLRRRDGQTNLRGQAARFRVFECERDAAGKLESATEVTADAATIEWGVHLVNRKAAADRFDGGGRRNNATGNDAADAPLIIDSGPQRLASPALSVNVAGRFKGVSVPLGRLITEPNGRLCVIGGRGDSRSPGNQPIVNFADNDDWHDDVSDGPITATIRRGGQTVTAKSSWVVVAPPDFAPEIPNIISLYDVLLDLGVKRQLMTPPPIVFFDKHIEPILKRAMLMQWVNRAARLGYEDTQSGGHSSGGPGDFAAMIKQLNDPTTPNAPRQRIFRLLRDPTTGNVPSPTRLKHMPRLNDDADSGSVLPLTALQFRAFKEWSDGRFQKAEPPGTSNELLPDALTRVALEACAGGAFFPGIEIGRIIRDPTKYESDEIFRLLQTAVRPGDITARNALPWQADYHQCRWEEESGNKRLGWWPAQRPDEVLKNATDDPVPWARGLADRGESYVKHWFRLGFVKRSAADPDVFLEDERDPTLAENGAV
jgi:hypothetical protein